MTAPRDPISVLATHTVANQPPPLEDYDLFAADPALDEALRREGAGWARGRVQAMGVACGTGETIALGFAANRHPPELKAFDRYGRRIDEVEFHPAWHALMTLGLEAGVHSVAWSPERPGAHVAHAALEYLLTQAEAGVCCPLTMTCAAWPALRQAPELAARWGPKILADRYDPRLIPVEEKGCATVGMAMTEKQGGSDVRANTTTARLLEGDAYALTGHKWFCSAPMSDAFFTLAQGPAGLTCFFVPRFTPDGHRNRIFIQRLKDKLGNRSNASAEIEYDGAWAQVVGEPGRGIAAIMEMVRHTRLDAAVVCAGMMRQAAVQAVHHAVHRRAFGKPLIDQPAMRAVLADLVVEAEAALALVMRVARAFDGATAEERAFARLAVAVAKFWVTKRLPGQTCEALECLGGNGYVEEGMAPRLYREAPLNAIWEGSGNVNALDVLRALGREPESWAAFRAELELARGADARLDRAIDRLADAVAAAGEGGARRLVEDLATTLQATLLVRHAPAAVAEAFLASRLSGEMRGCYGALPAGLDLDGILDRAPAP
ncbi:MAG TPA: acyl-CoA dehydrogenase family protein [Caulobacteraceae bacterium]|jgi:putative acyl-CoA dehydrogenase|nr:acyl-CoA dehydrogenase family protein [Caulobacteraceae bacterium]